MIRFLFGLLLLASACSTLPKDYEKQPSERSYIIPLEVTPQLTPDVVKEEYRDSVHLFASHREGIPLDTGTYTVAYKGCGHYRELYTDLQFKKFEDKTLHIHFKKNDDWENSDIRILCADSLGWTSYIGQDIFKLKKSQWTTSFGKEYYMAYVEYTTWHELFGHCIMGLDHEQHNQTGRGISWNRSYLYNDFKQRFGWGPKEVEQWITAHDLGYISTNFDPLSIMLYYYACEYTTDGFGCGSFNYHPSMGDWYVWFNQFGQAPVLKP